MVFLSSMLCCFMYLSQDAPDKDMTDSKISEPPAKVPDSKLDSSLQVRGDVHILIAEISYQLCPAVTFLSVQ